MNTTTLTQPNATCATSITEVTGRRPTFRLKPSTHKLIARLKNEIRVAEAVNVQSRFWCRTPVDQRGSQAGPFHMALRSTLLYATRALMHGRKHAGWDAEVIETKVAAIAAREASLNAYRKTAKQSEINDAELPPHLRVMIRAGLASIGAENSRKERWRARTKAK